MRFRQRKSDRQPVTPNQLAQMQNLRQRGLSHRMIAKELGVHERTVRRKLLSGVTSGKLGRFRSVFTKEQEAAIVTYAKAVDARFFGLTLKNLRSIAFEFAEINKIRHPFPQTSRLAGCDWTRAYMKRNRLSLRVPRKTSVARVMGFNRDQVGAFFTNLKELLRKYKFPSQRIYNMDEVGLQTVPNKLEKHVAPIGKREVSKVVSAEQGKTVTIAASMNALGHFPPPFFIFARKKINRILIKDAPEGSEMAVTDSAYMNSEVFPRFIDHFKNATRPTAEDPVLLILDNHISHVNRDSIIYAKRNNIHMLSLPPHSSHKTQPLDRAFFRPFKAFYTTACDNWSTSHPGQVITEYHVAAFAKQAFESSASVKTATSGFKTTGIFPLNENIFTDADFLPSTVTDQEEDSHGVDHVDANDDEMHLLIEFLEETNAEETELIEYLQHLDERDALNNPPPADNNLPAPQPTMNNLPAPQPEAAENNGPAPLPAENVLPPVPLLVLPEDIVPLPKSSFKRKRSKKSLKSTNLTSTPHLEEL